MVKSEKKRITFTAIAVILVGVITGLLFGTSMSGGAPPTKTFNVIAYHWGYALFDENWNEIKQMEVNLGTTVRLNAYPVNLFSQELQKKFYQRVVDKGLSISLVKDGPEIKLPPGDPKIAEIIEAARTNPETLSHGVSIEVFNVDLSPKADKSIFEGAIASIEFTPDALGSFKLNCSIECGPGHAFFAMADALIVK